MNEQKGIIDKYTEKEFNKWDPCLLHLLKKKNKENEKTLSLPRKTNNNVARLSVQTYHWSSYYEWTIKVKLGIGDFPSVSN